MRKTIFKSTAAVLALSAVAAGLPGLASAQDGKKFKVFLSLSYSGNAWQSEAANIVKALAQTAPYNEMVELREVISGTDPQAQISAYESMIDEGADAIISFPISSTALNRTIKRGCDEGVLFFMYDATVTESCAYNVSYLSSGFGENSAQALVNALEGKGKIFLSRGVPGNSVDQRHTDGAMHIFNQYPGIEVVAEYYSYWDDRTTQQETAKALTANPDVDGIWAQAPYLHNGSVPTLGQVICPTTRPARFVRGNVNYDEALVGFEWAAKPGARYSPNDSLLVKEYDTTVTGKSNAGHTFGADLCPDTTGLDPVTNRQEIATRLLGSKVGALLEYLKTR